MEKKKIPDKSEKKKKSFPDWGAIRNDYITGNESPKECARSHGVNYRTLGNHLSWGGDR